MTIVNLQTSALPNSLASIIDVSTPYVVTDKQPKKQAPDAIKDPKHIEMIKNYFVTRGKFRDNLLFTIGITTAFRCGDILRFKVGTLLEAKPDGSLAYREEYIIEEEKTGKIRKAYMHKDVKEAFELYLASTGKNRELDLNSLLFVSESNRKSAGASSRHSSDSLWVDSVSKILRKAIKDLGLNYRVASHTMRKTFSYHFLMSFDDRDRGIECLQKVLNHSSRSETLKYIGITEAEITKHTLNLYRNNNGAAPIRRIMAG